MKKVLTLDTGKEWGGGTNSLLELLKRIDRDKYHFSVLFYNNCRQGNDSDIKTEIEKLGIEFLLLKQMKQPVTAKILKESVRIIFFFSKRLKKHFIFFIDYHFRIKQNAERIAGILKSLKIDMLYMNNQPSSNLEGIIASKMRGIPALQHSRIETELNPFEVKAVNQDLAKMICVSEGVRNKFVKQGVDPSGCIVVHNGIDSELRPRIEPHEIRKKWNIPENDILTGTVGSLIKRKRIKDLVEAIHIITTKTDTSIKCLIIGEGPEKDNLLELVKRKNLNDKIIFTGFQTDAVSYINAMDVFVMTSEQEGLPRVVLEAMLMGKPVVASDITGPSELVADRETGFLMTAGKPAMFADAILKLVENPELRMLMGQNARKRAIKKFSIEKYVKGVQRVFAGVLDG
ncbi:MAG TPA: glycosyltransferase family 1 protein [Nitrospirae bacterium]|nr:putative glycosyltransferase EpsD [bacterium BMS3Abin06]HDH12370.1 glycosyltransferase family 1 protein [Nitrospirota bacterium]HDZ01252.1 glycosyltransferase family 1 protein [Nitrospirota bacterium]